MNKVLPQDEEDKKHYNNKVKNYDFTLFKIKESNRKGIS